jgi:CRISPR/Cas system-associated protein Cas10 (large subunit of type III CRISPR-Cas system)
MHFTLSLTSTEKNKKKINIFDKITKGTFIGQFGEKTEFFYSISQSIDRTFD